MQDDNKDTFSEQDYIHNGIQNLNSVNFICKKWGRD